MGAVTAAVIAGAATMISTGVGVAAQQGAFGGGSGGGDGKDWSRTPMDPHQRAMRDYYARMAVVNQDKTYPSFGAFLSSGGDPALSEFDLEKPGMKPSEAAALGLVGGRGEAIPYYDQETMPANLTAEQRIYLARERRRRARETGSKPPPWTHSEAVLNARDRYARRRTRYEEAAATPEGERTLRQQRAYNRIPAKLENMESRWRQLDLQNTGTGPGAPRPPRKEEDDGSPLKRIMTGGTSGK